ncbi:3D domain-containing protein [Romboutsia sp. 13368]|uniref:3D domain-containing protein n=1 Tax=Romboutsia sp. 13368 TaxID=2708053 RepID=UPI0025D52D32|nr:3D domain-containing protein [Romboutsia sp. 13368]
MKKKLMMSTVAMTVMLGFNTLAFADTINNNLDVQVINEEELNYNNGYVNAVNVNFRKGASINSDIYKLVQKNTSVTILGYEGDWTKVSIDDEVGYIYSTYVSEGEPTKESFNLENATPLEVKATAYAGDTITSTGTVPKAGYTIAVDPSVIPYGTRVYIPEFDKVFVAEDCGSAIKGNRIDIFMESEAKCNEWGVKNITIHILP